MKHTRSLFRWVLNLCLVFLMHLVQAQESVVQYLDVGTKNATVLSESYLYPYASMIDATLLGGWNMSPRVQRSGKFTVHVFVNQGFRESGDNLMNIGDKIDKGQLNGITLKDPSQINAATATFKLKSGQGRPVMIYQGNEVATPNGADISALRLPSMSFSIGIPSGTEISAKFTPPMDYPDLGKTLQWGLGVKHSIKNYLALLRNAPYLEAAVMGTYANFRAESTVSYHDQTRQSLVVNGSALSGRFIMGLHFNKADIYGSVGYGSRKSDFTLSGTYEDVPDEGGGVISVSDPVRNAYDFSGMEYEAGIQLRLYFLNLQVGYAFSNYSMVSMGAGISF